MSERIFKIGFTAMLLVACLAIAANAGNQTQPTGIRAVSCSSGINCGTSAGTVTATADTSVVQHRFTGACSAGNAVQGVDSAGNPTCIGIGTGTVTSVGCGTGLTGGTFTTSGTCAVDNTLFQARISTACGAGQAIQSVSSGGTPTCISTGGGATFDPTTAVNYFADFVNGNSASGSVWDGFYTSNFAGTGAQVQALADEQGHPGIVRFSTGTTATGRASMVMGLSTSVSFLFGVGAHSFDILVRPQTLCDSTTDICILDCGFLDTVTAESVDGMYLKYNPASSANWRTVMTSNSVAIEADSSPAQAVAANTWVHLQGAMNAAGTSGAFSVNGTLVGTVTTNIPTGAGRNFGAGCTVVKSAGTNARTFDLDYSNINITGLSR